jgi:hypothetical protein
MPLTPGARLGAYEVIGTLGAGGMGACGQPSERSETRLRGAGVGPRATRRSGPRAHAGTADAA